MKDWRIWLIATSIVIAGITVYFSLVSRDRSESYQGAELSGDAPDFKLTDQNGELVRLSDFGGKVIVLTFMDSQCREVCPLTASQLIQTYKSLEPKDAGQVAFLAVNANAEANSVADVLHATQSWRLEEIPSWHFLTGEPEDLGSVWRDYGIGVTNDPDARELLHTSGIFLIDQNGQMRRYVSTPYSEDGIAEWTLPLSELLVNHVREILSSRP